MKEYRSSCRLDCMGILIVLTRVMLGNRILMTCDALVNVLLGCVKERIEDANIRRRFPNLWPNLLLGLFWNPYNPSALNPYNGIVVTIVCNHCFVCSRTLQVVVRSTHVPKTL